MRALVRRGGGVHLEDIAAPRLERDDDVLIAVSVAGICRTDLYVARGLLPVSEPRVLGHEFAGVVLEAGPSASFSPGEPVCVIPLIDCGVCPGCVGLTECVEPLFLGVHVDGAFAERIVVPAGALMRRPASMSARHAAYVEPVAAALAVLNAPLAKNGRGLVLGDNRIATLILRILDLYGFANICGAPPDRPPRGDLFDFVIETEANAETVATMLALLKPNGLAVLKSRPAAPVPVDIAMAVKRNLRLFAVAYGPFDQAIELLSSGKLAVDDILGPSFALEDFETAFAAAEASNAAKLFLSISPEPQRLDAAIAESRALA